MKGFIFGDPDELFAKLHGNMPRVARYKVRNVKGVTFEIHSASCFRKAATLAGHEYHAYNACSVSGIEYVVESTSPELPHRVEISNCRWEEYRLDIQQALIELSAIVDRPVELRYRGADGTNLSKPDDNWFRINLWSYLLGEAHGKVSLPNRLWGIPTSRRCGAFAPSGTGTAITDPDSEHKVAEVFANDLFVNLDLQRGICEYDAQILLQIIQHAAEELDSEDTEDRLRNKFHRLLGHNLTNLKAKTESAINDLDAEIKALQDKLARRIALRDGRAQKLAALQQVQRNGETVMTMFDAIITDDRFTNMKIKHGVLSVATSPWFCEDESTGIIYRLGELTLTIHPSGKNGIIRVQSSEGKNFSGTGRAIPHANKDGSIERAEAVEAISELAAFNKYDELLDVALSVASSADPTTMLGADVIKWPVASAEELIGTEWEGRQIAAAA